LLYNSLFVSDPTQEILAVDTPERVEIEFALAGIGTRALAQLVDVSIVFLAVFSIFYLAVFGLTLHPHSGTPSQVIIAATLLLFLVQWGYFLCFEAFWNGQTPGKKLCGIRVVMAEGVPVTFLSAATRNLLRVVDFLPAGYALGFLWMFFHPESRRLGDVAAGTLVVRESAMTIGELEGRLLTLSNTETDLTPLAARVGTDLDDYNLISDFLSRVGGLEDEQRHELAVKLALPFMQRAGLTGDELASVYPRQDRHERFLRELAKLYAGRRGTGS
jgi:uncharacterized RDD family membrane protein YckC